VETVWIVVESPRDGLTTDKKGYQVRMKLKGKRILSWYRKVANLMKKGDLSRERKTDRRSLLPIKTGEWRGNRDTEKNNLHSIVLVPLGGGGKG